MTLKYHGTPFTPWAAFHQAFPGRMACVSWYRPDQIKTVAEVCSAFLLDNGAFSHHTKGTDPDWPGYYAWTEKWMAYPNATAIVPDVIVGGEEENDALAAQWPHDLRRSLIVWHLHESIQRLQRIVEKHGQVAFGSSAQYWQIGSPAWHRRIHEALDAVHQDQPRIHMLRGLQTIKWGLPWYSVDSASVALHHSEKKNPLEMMAGWDAIQCPPWRDWSNQQQDLFGEHTA